MFINCIYFCDLPFLVSWLFFFKNVSDFKINFYKLFLDKAIDQICCR